MRFIRVTKDVAYIPIGYIIYLYILLYLNNLDLCGDKHFNDVSRWLFEIGKMFWLDSDCIYYCRN